ncbi:MAG: AI-2E family transporter [Planctomycetes bacterium]|nr:AI-2E family transporter [Planctomycetota bacterium]
MKRLFSFLVLIGIVAVFGFLSFEVLSGFLLPLFLAILLVVIFRPLHLRLSQRLGGRERLAAGITTLSVLLILLLPALWIVTRAATESISLVSDFDQQSMLKQADEWRRKFDLDLPGPLAEQRLGEIEASLHRLGEPSQFPFGRDDSISRQQTIERLVLLTGQFVHELWPAEVGAPTDEAVAARQKVLSDRIAAFQDELGELLKARKDDAAFRAALAKASGTFEELRLSIYGGPVRSWVKHLLRLDPAQVDQIREEVRTLAGPMAVGTTQFVGTMLLQVFVGLAVMTVALYYFLADGPAMIDHLMTLTPLENRYEVQLLDEFSQLMRAILLAMLLSAAVQGILMSGAYLWCGFESVFLLTVLTMVLAIVPFVGAIPVWGSCSLWLLIHDGRPQAAAVLAVYAIVVGVVGDNVIKPLVLHGRSNLHPLLGLLSVLGGAQALGPIGIVVGPMVVAILQTLLSMLRTELATLDLRGNETRPAVPTISSSPEATNEAATVPTGSAS